jgi:hypothetical protein
MINAVYIDMNVYTHILSLAQIRAKNAWEGAEICR